MKKADFIEKVAEESGLSKVQAGKAVDALTSVVTKELASGGSVQIVGFGTFDVRTAAAHTARNPFAGGTVDVPEKHFPRFKAGKSFKEAVK